MTDAPQDALAALAELVALRDEMDRFPYDEPSDKWDDAWAEARAILSARESPLGGNPAWEKVIRAARESQPDSNEEWNKRVKTVWWPGPQQRQPAGEADALTAQDRAEIVRVCREYGYAMSTALYDQLFLAGKHASPAAPMKRETQCEIRIDMIRAAIREYYAALCNREHGGVAQDKAFGKIERALEMSWDDYKAELAATAQKDEP